MSNDAAGPPRTSQSNLTVQSLADWYIGRFASTESHTARAKRLDVDHFLQFLKRHRRKKSIEELRASDWDHSSTEAFVENRLSIGESPATVARRLATLKHMGRILAEQRADFVNPARDVKPPRIEVLRPKALAESEVIQIRESAPRISKNPRSFSAIRNSLLFNFLIETGLRLDEVRLLRRHQLSENLEWISQVRTKGKRFRNVYISSGLRGQIVHYLERRESELARVAPALSPAKEKRLPLFISNYGSQSDDPDSFLLSPKTIWRIIRSMTVDTRLHPHLLRHTFAIELLESSKDIRLVAQALGHSDVRVTMRYTERTDEEIAKAIEKKGKS